MFLVTIVGDVMSDLQGRRAMIMGMDSEAGYQKLQAKIPLKELANYSISLSSLTGWSCKFHNKVRKLRACSK